MVGRFRLGAGKLQFVVILGQLLLSFTQFGDRHFKLLGPLGHFAFEVRVEIANCYVIALELFDTFAYVATNDENIVSVISTATNSVVDTVIVGSRPPFVAITPDGAFAYVTNASSANVSVINTATNAVVATVAVGDQPIGVAITPAEVVDTDGDGVDDPNDNCVNDANPGQEDQDGDGIGDVCDPDRDGDGFVNEEDDFPDDPTEWDDTDSDGIGNNADTDDDDDTMPDDYEVANGLDSLNAADAATDADGDGFTNLEEFQAGTDPQNAADFPVVRKVPVAIFILLGEEEQ